MTGKYTPEVKDCSVFKEIALNTVNPLEIIREAISNADDANANHISISIDRDKKGQLLITIEDNGDGMGIEDIHRFFNLGFSHKELCKIGEKGLGTKTFYKSDRIYLDTCNKDGRLYTVCMDNPWTKLENNEIPSYEIKEVKEDVKKGTKIIIYGYKIDNPEKFFNIETLKDYIQWFTIGGSFRNIFASNIKIKQQINNIDIVPQIIINDKINDKSEIIVGIHQFEEPNESPIAGSTKDTFRKSKNYARMFGPFNKETNINGDYVSVQVYGAISGINAKRKICKLAVGETYKNRFGLYLCKDFIPCVKMDTLLDTDDFYHYHIVANSQNFKLTSDRNNISNIDDIKIKWVLNEIKDIINTQIKPIAVREYFSMIKKEEDEYRARVKCERTKKNIRKIEKSEDLGIEELSIVKKPRNEFETALLFSSILSNTHFKSYIPYIKNILSYSAKTPTDMVCLDYKGSSVLVEVELKLSNFLKHKHPIETVDYIVCWNVDLEEYKIHRINDMSCIFINKEQCKYLTFDEKEIVIIDLKAIIDKINESIEFV